MKKTAKVKSVRTYDKEGYRLRAGCICYQYINGLLKILLISTRGLKKWIIPAGGIDPNETPVSAAIREVYEEAGIRGITRSFIGVFTNHKNRSKTHLFSLEITEFVDKNLWIESFRKRTLLSPNEALEELTKPEIIEFVKCFMENIKRIL